MSSLQVHTKLQHLTIEEINTLMERYYNGEKTNDLINEYRVACSTSQLYTLFPPIVENVMCPFCKTQMVTLRPSRTSRVKAPSCPICDHTGTDHCFCGNCAKIKRDEQIALQERKRNVVAEVYDLGSLNPIDIDEISLRDKLYLSALIRSQMEENFNYLKAVDKNATKIAPSSDYTLEMLRSLMRKEVIKVHPNSPLESFVDDEKFPYTIYTYSTNFHINVAPIDGDKKLTIEMLTYPEPNEFLKSPDFCYEMWRELALEESKQYLLYSLKQVAFELNIGDKTIATLNYLLDNFSTSQVYSIIYRSINYAVRFYQEKRVTKQHAANSVVSAMERNAERAIAEKWTIKGFHRLSELPQTSLSEVFFNRVLRIGLKGFEEKPSLDVIYSFVEEN